MSRSLPLKKHPQQPHFGLFLEVKWTTTLDVQTFIVPSRSFFLCMFKQLTKQLLLLGLPRAVLLYCLAPVMVYYTESVLYTEMSSVYHLCLSVWALGHLPPR